MKIKKVILVLLVLFAFIASLLPQPRMIIENLMINSREITEFTLDGSTIYMSGEINSKTPDQLKKIISENSGVKTLVLIYVPGSNDDEANLSMANWIREIGLNTHLTKDSIIASGGTDLFLAGVNRTMVNGAKIGVHSWQDTFGVEAKDLPKEHPDHEMNRKYVEDMLGKDDFYWYTIYAAQADDIYWMGNDEIIKYNMLTGPVQ